MAEREKNRIRDLMRKWNKSCVQKDGSLIITEKEPEGMEICLKKK